MVNFRISEQKPQLVDSWNVSSKFVSNGRIVDEHGKTASVGYQGKTYKLYEKHERKFSSLEFIGRVSLGIFISVISCFSAPLLSKRVCRLFKNKETIRFGKSFNTQPLNFSDARSHQPPATQQQVPVTQQQVPVTQQPLPSTPSASERVANFKNSVANEVAKIEAKIRQQVIDIKPKPSQERLALVEKARDWLKLKPEERTFDKAVKYGEDSGKDFKQLKDLFNDEDYVIQYATSFANRIIQQVEFIAKATKDSQDQYDMMLIPQDLSHQLKMTFNHTKWNLTTDQKKEVLAPYLEKYKHYIPAF